MKDPRGVEIVHKLLAGADVFSENFKSGSMDKLGLGSAALSKLNPRLFYVSHKGFLPGPYDHRTALDEVFQMMGGLAYMTGPDGRPLRAGTSVNDIMGGMFGAIGAMAALAQRERTGKGQEVQSALFENNVFLVAQHMMQFAVTGRAAAEPHLGVGSVRRLHREGRRADLSGGRVGYAVGAVLRRVRFRRPEGGRAHRHQQLAHAVARRAAAVSAQAYGVEAFSAVFERIGLPYAPITKSQDLFDDPHLLATGGLADVTLPPDASGAGKSIPTCTVLLPLPLDGECLRLRAAPSALGQDTQALLMQLSYALADVRQLTDAGVICCTDWHPGDESNLSVRQRTGQRLNRRIARKKPGRAVRQYESRDIMASISRGMAADPSAESLLEQNAVKKAAWRFIPILSLAYFFN